jgi:preprotein translocase subunit SecG
MSILLNVVHIIVCIALIMIVLLQTGKGADMGAAFGGGGSQTLFGSTGASTFLSKATTAAAVIFMLTSLSLAYVSSRQGPTGSIMETQQAPADQTAPAPGNTDTGTEAAPANPATSDSNTKK